MENSALGVQKTPYDLRLLKINSKHTFSQNTVSVSAFETICFNWRLTILFNNKLIIIMLHWKILAIVLARRYASSECKCDESLNPRCIMVVTLASSVPSELDWRRVRLIAARTRYNNNLEYEYIYTRFNIPS